MSGWLFYSILSAVFAAMVAILAKIGIKNIDSNLATAIRTTVILVFTWGLVAITGTLPGIQKIDKWSFLFLVLSGLATGLSWIFYFKALQLTAASKVVPIDKLSLVFTIILSIVILREKVNLQMWVGVILMTLGSILIAAAK